MKKISAVIITFNEERNIGRCLESLKDVVDEIIVVDSFSTDKTEEICNLYGAKFIKHIFEGHIEQKNWALTQTSHPYVLSLDADEVLDETLKKSILEIKSNWTADGYSMNRLTNYCGKWIKHCGWYPDKKLRLFDKQKGAWGGVNPHDIYKLNDVNKKIIHLKGDLHHYSYYSINDHLMQAHKFTTLTAEEAFRRGKNISAFGIYVKSSWKFIRDYFMKLGFLDGYAGYLICKTSAFATFLKYVKLKEMNKNSVSHEK